MPTNVSAIDMAAETDIPFEVRHALERSLRAHADAVSYLGARAAVLSRFLDITLPLLTAAQTRAVAAALQLAIQDAIGATQSPELSARHHTTLREYSRAVLERLDNRSAEGRGRASRDQHR